MAEIPAVPNEFFTPGKWVAVSSSPYIVGKITKVDGDLLTANPVVNLSTGAYTGPIIWKKGDVSPFDAVGTIPNPS